MILVGTSGWQYPHWRGGLYPSGLPQRLWLERYAEVFATVEVNNAFYRLPERTTFEAWRQRTPPDFVVGVKMSRYLTHVLRLRDPAEPVARFLSRTAGLGSKLGPVLLQLPPTLAADAQLLDATLREFPAGVRVVVEARHPSWFNDDVRGVLVERHAALCWADRGGLPVAPLWRTAGFGYLRLHGGRATPRPHYGDRALDGWLTRLSEHYADGADAYVYFNNDQGGAAVIDALTLGRRATHLGLRVARGGRQLVTVSALPGR